VDINTAKIKYIVAREGLIIIFLLLCAGASFYANSWQTGKIDNYVKDAKEVALNYNPFDKYDPSPKSSIQNDYKIQFQKTTPYDVEEHTLKNDFSWHGGEFGIFEAERAQPTNIHIVARYDAKGNKLFTGFLWEIDFLKVMYFFLFLAYPAYLLIRFIVWASLTVRNRKLS
jgi:hypothetical protein